METTAENITFIGMPAAGKTKIGKNLALLTHRDFIDTDDRICEVQGEERLQDVVDKLSGGEFAELECRVALDIVRGLTRPTVIATGGSMVYYRDAMQALREKTHIIYLAASFETIARRIAKNPDRGIVFKAGQSLQDLFRMRTPLYERWAHETVSSDCERGKVAELLARQFA